ncbi:hypothetical protein [Halocatena halophila]
MTRHTLSDVSHTPPAGDSVERVWTRGTETTEDGGSQESPSE